MTIVSKLNLTDNFNVKIIFYRYAAKRGDPVPKFHYEVRAYSRVVCNTDLTDNELEFTVHQGINLSGPKDLDSYCK